MEGDIRILYMEDDSGLARLLQKGLQRQGYKVDTVANGTDGLTILKSIPYDIVLVDYNMPECSGLDVIRQLTGQENGPPVIMVTGNGNEKIAVEALKVGATDYIVKDVDMGYLEILPIVISQTLQKEQLVRERKQMFRQIQESEERYRKLVELSPDGLVVYRDDHLEFVNPAGRRILGMGDDAEYSSLRMTELLHPDSQEKFIAHLESLGEAGTGASWLELVMLRLDRMEIDVELSGVPFVYQGKQAIQIIFRDIAERRRAKERLEFMAHYDLLTGLPNRTLFFDRLSLILENAERYGEKFALLFLDLDRFKEVNDSFGHDIGDSLLQQVGTRLTECLRKAETVARMGGDEFAIILSRVKEANDAGTVAGKIINSLNRPFALFGHECSIGASIGISIYPCDGKDTGILLKKADTAMYEAKDKGRNVYCFSTESTEY